jgi:DNA-binding CsgD family transcriptional regulator
MHHLALDGQEYLVIAVPLVDDILSELLTSAECEVAQSAALGLSNADIAKKRGTSVPTVVNQLGAIYKKLGVSGRVGLCSLFSRQGPRSA